MALIAAGNGLGAGIVMTLGADAAPVDGRSQFLGAWRLCGDIGNTGGPLLVSAVAAVAPAGDRLPRGRRARSGRRGLGRLLDRPGRPRTRRRDGRRGGQPTVTVTSLEVTWVSVSITRNLFGPVRLVWT